METDDEVAPRSPRPAGLRGLIALAYFRLQAVSLMAYMGAASFIGIEMAALVIGFTSAMPIVIPFVVLVIGGLYFLRERIRQLWTKIIPSRASG